MLANPNTLLNLHLYIQLVAHQDSNLCMYIYIYIIYLMKYKIFIDRYVHLYIYGKSTHQMAPPHFTELDHQAPVSNS